MALSGDGGKGYGRRKPLVPEEVIDNNWATIFGKKTKMRGQGEEALDAYNEERLVSKYDKENLKDKK
jgi:hypothetical protein